MHGRSDGNSHLLFDFTRRGLMNVGEVVVEHDRDVWILSLRGEHDLATTPNLRDELERALGGDSRVVVDLSEVEFIDCTVLASLAHGYDRAKNSDPPTMAIGCPEAESRIASSHSSASTKRFPTTVTAAGQSRRFSAANAL
jgi:anti-anti-sigma factor